MIDAADLTTAASDGALSIPMAAPMPLQRVAQAHDRVDEGTRERLLLTIPTEASQLLTCTSVALPSRLDNQ